MGSSPKWHRQLDRPWDAPGELGKARLKHLRSASVLYPAAVSRRRSCLPDRPRNSSLLTTVRDAFISAISTPRHGRRALAAGHRPRPQTAELHHHGGRRSALRVMIAIHIFEENRRFSKQTSHSGPRTVEDAVILAAGRRAAISRGSRTDFRSL